MYYDFFYIEPKRKNRKWRKISIKKYIKWFDKQYGGESSGQKVISKRRNEKIKKKEKGEKKK